MKNPQKTLGNREESSSDKRRELPCRYINCKKPSCKIWHPPVCQNYMSETHGRKCFFRHVEADEADEKPSKKVIERWCKRISCDIEGVLQVGCVSQDSYPRKSIPSGKGKFGSKHAVKFFKGTWHQIKIRERNGPSRGIIPKCGPHQRGPCAPKFGERSHEETLHQEGCVRRAAWDLANKYSQTPEFSQCYLVHSY